MFLTVISPIGFISTLDLLSLPVWRMELRAGPFPEADSNRHLQLGVAYLSPNGSAFATICGIDCKVQGDELKPVVRVGLPHQTRSQNKERLREALKVLVNCGIKVADVEEISAASAALVDAYHDIQRALWGFNPSLSNVGPAAKGELQGWRWALLQAKRFSPWLADTGTDLSAPPAEGTSIGRSTKAPMPPAPAGSAGAPAATEPGVAIVNDGPDELDPSLETRLGDAPGTPKPPRKARNRP